MEGGIQLPAGDTGQKIRHWMDWARGAPWWVKVEMQAWEEGSGRARAMAMAADRRFIMCRTGPAGSPGKEEERAGVVTLGPRAPCQLLSHVCPHMPASSCSRASLLDCFSF